MPIHEYEANVVWTGGKDGTGRLELPNSGESFPLAIGEEFGGPGGATNPEELLTSAVASCYAMTFGIIAANRKLPVASCRANAVGHVEQQGPSFTFKSILIRPEIQLDSSATDDQIKIAAEMALKADHYCIITNTIRGKVDVTVEPYVTRA